MGLCISCFEDGIGRCACQATSSCLSKSQNRLLQFTVSSSTELSISCYDRWADRLGELVSTGDLLHICGTGAIVAENAA